MDVIKEIKKLNPVLWKNKNKESFKDIVNSLPMSYEDIVDASNRLERFAPLIERLFPETKNGIIESPLAETNSLKHNLESRYTTEIKGKLYLKCDSHLKIAGSIKARGGIYEVLKHAEDIALEKDILSVNDDYSILANKEFKELFSNYKIAVGSTGNLGLSIGIISSALGFKVDVHMSSDAKEWKKEILRSKGANVIEYEDDYSKAVEEGRKQCEGNDYAYFIDDENSKDLFLGYSVAALRLKKQLEEKSISVDENHQLYVYLPCGVGGAPGGIAFGLKHIFDDNVHCYFVEPTHAPCMLLGLVTEKYSDLKINNYGIDNITEADGLAVGSPSKLVSEMASNFLDGIYTIEDDELFKLLRLVKDVENIKIEPSAASSVLGPTLVNANNNDTHICWLTGGIFVPDSEYQEMYNKGLEN
nr:D-serine ammonia-lyase [Sporosalibacterium faouarense]